MNDLEKHNKSYKDTVLNLYSAMPNMTQKDSELLSYVLQKTDRIASTCTRIASLIGQHDVLAKDIETTSLVLVRDAARMARNSAARAEVLDHLLELVAVLSLAATSGRVAQGNVGILLEEVSQLANVVQQYELGSVRTLSSITGSAVAMPTVRQDQRTTARPAYDQRHQTDNVLQRDGDINRQAQETRPIEERASDSVGMQQYRERLQEVQKDRRATILGLLQKKDRITVKDVAAVIKDCSEKTIQRELLALVAQGVLKKEGERRWSTYLLV